MVFIATETGFGGTNHNIGLRRMVRTGAPSFGANTPTGVTVGNERSVADGVEVGAGVCVLNRGFDSSRLNSTATIHCFGDNGALTTTAETPSGTAYHRYAGGMMQVGGELVVAGSFSASSSNAEVRYTRLYLERRRASDLVVVGSRVDHDITLTVPSPSPVKDLTVAKLAQDAQGRWLVAGHVTRQQGSALTEAFVARFNADFSRDTTFGTNGVVNLEFGGVGANPRAGVASDLAVLDNGIIVVNGLGCISATCSTPGNTLTRQSLTKILLPTGAFVVTFSGDLTTESDARLPQLEATRKPYIPGDGAGYVEVRPLADGRVEMSTRAVSASGELGFGRFNQFRLRYISDSNVAVPQSFANLVTTQDAGRTRHYMAWTYKPDNANATDTDMVMGELQSLTIFADGFE